MILVVSGGRDLKDWRLVHQALDEIHAKTRVTFLAEGGHPNGADKFARSWARRHRVTNVSFVVTEKEWTTLGKRAGPRRNGRMLVSARPDLLLAFPTGGPGTADCMKQAKQMGIPVRAIAVLPAG